MASKFLDIPRLACCYERLEKKFFLAKQNSLVGGCDDCAKSGGGRLTYDVIVLNFAIFRTNVCVLFVTIRSSAIQWISLLLKGIKGKRVILHFVWKVLSKKQGQNSCFCPKFGGNIKLSAHFLPKWSEFRL